MIKPDWATRLQRTFARKYDAGFAKGLMFGKAVGAADERERILGLLQGQLCREGCDCYECEALLDLQANISGEKRCYCVGTWGCPVHEATEGEAD